MNDAAEDLGHLPCDDPPCEHVWCDPNQDEPQFCSKCGVTITAAQPTSIAKVPEAPPLAAVRPRLYRAIELVAEEIAELLGSGSFDPRTFQRVDKLTRICRALRAQIDAASLRLGPHERGAALGMNGLRCGPHQDELGMGDFPEDYGDEPVGRFHVGRAVNPVPYTDRDFSTEKELAMLNGAAAVVRLLDKQAGVAKLDELVKLQTLLDSKHLAAEDRARLQRQAAALMKEIGDDDHASVSPEPSDDRDVVPADDVR